MLFKKPKRHIINLKVGDFEVEVTFKPIKNLYLKVSRKTGGIRVSAPSKTSESLIRNFVISRSQWIKKHLDKPVKFGPELKYVDSEEHKFFGSKAFIKIDYINNNTKAYYHNSTIILKIKQDSDIEKRMKLVDALYRKELKILVCELIKKWEPVMDVKVNEFGIRKMKTRWGTCNIRDQRIWMNLHLAKEKPEVIEMVLVHEMVHLLERLHSKKFYAYMDQFLPNWKDSSRELDGRVC